MRGSFRLIAVLIACAPISIVLLGCGGTGNRADGVAVRVGTSVIRKASIEHWLPIESYLSGRDLPKTAPPRGLIPDPPSYAACISYEREKASKGVSDSKPTVGELKTRCRQRWHSDLIHTVDSLILDHWLLGEAAERGLSVSNQETQKAFSKNRRHLFRSVGDFNLYLRSTGQTEADELYRAKSGMLATKVLENVIIRRGSSEQEAHRAYAIFLKKWIAKTDCTPEYIAPNCKQYKGPLQPGA